MGCRNGLNKDEPSRPLHNEALEVARQSTAAFVSSIIGELASLEAVNFLKGLDSNRSDVDMVIVRCVQVYSLTYLGYRYNRFHD